jgi:pimeloyl-ACP methyl ester carboxylesterase
MQNAKTPLLAIYLLCASLALNIPVFAAQPEHHTVVVAQHKVAVWSRLPTRPQHVILLVHGRTWSAIPDFDLQVPEKNRSVMQSLNKLGYATYAIDLRGYGATPRNTNGWTTPQQAADDVAQVLQWIELRHQKLPKPVLLGWSNGAVVAQFTAQQHPELISDLILLSYPRDPAAIPTMPPAPAEPTREVNTSERAISDFISPRVTKQTLIDAYVIAALKADPVRADWNKLEEFSALDPAKIHTPTLVIHGERDPLAPLTLIHISMTERRM